MEKKLYRIIYKNPMGKRESKIMEGVNPFDTLFEFGSSRAINHEDIEITILGIYEIIKDGL